MTGRDLIVYIMLNKLEDEQVFKDGKLLGFLTEAEAAEIMNVGVATIRAWVEQSKIKGIFIGDAVYIPADFKSTLEVETCRKEYLRRGYSR